MRHETIEAEIVKNLRRARNNTEETIDELTEAMELARAKQDNAATAANARANRSEYNDQLEQYVELAITWKTIADSIQETKKVTEKNLEEIEAQLKMFRTL